MKEKIILGLETCTNFCSVALWDGQKMHELVMEKARSHSKTILPMVENLLKETGLSMSAIDAIACTRGPGSFTGVRIGIGVAKGLAYGQNLPIYPISPLQTLAYQVMQVDTVGEMHQITALLDARMQELYTANYQVIDDKPVLLGEEQLLKIEDIPVGEQWFAGTGMQEYRVILDEQKAHCSSVIYPLASAVICCAQFGDVQTVSAADLKPVYLRDKVTD